MKRVNVVLLGILVASPCVWPQTQSQYSGSNVTGWMTLSGTVNLMQQAQFVLSAQRLSATSNKETLPKVLAQQLRPAAAKRLALTAQSLLSVPTLQVSTSFAGFGFMGLTHMDQRDANSGNQFSVEPPSQGLAVANGFIVEGVNNAVQVYNTSGVPLLPQVLATNQVFGVAPAINRVTGFNGIYPTDIRVFYDPDIQRWFILQWAQLNDAAGNLEDLSREWIAVSQTADPTETYNIYSMDTTDTARFGCPCIPDYPQIGADQYGVYISSNEFNTSSSTFIGANILAISKASLAAGSASPVSYKFVLPYASGNEFVIQPAFTPPGASYYSASGGLEYFASTQSGYGNSVALWAMTNTSSLATANPNPTLIRTTISTLSYSTPNVAAQRPGYLQYGSSLYPPGQLAYLDGGDTRVLSLCYSGGRLYLTFGTGVIDGNGSNLAGGAYVILSPTYRAGVVASNVLRQGYLAVTGQNILRPAIAVNAQGNGAIVFTLVGPSYYPSAAMLPIGAFATASTIQIAGPGVLPEDGFTGYPGGFYPGTARWGDYSAATVTSDGAIWMGTEYIPNAPRTDYANWGTFLMRYIP